MSTHNSSGSNGDTSGARASAGDATDLHAVRTHKKVRTHKSVRTFQPESRVWMTLCVAAGTVVALAGTTVALSQSQLDDGGYGTSLQLDNPAIPMPPGDVQTSSHYDQTTEADAGPPPAGTAGSAGYPVSPAVPTGASVPLSRTEAHGVPGSAPLLSGVLLELPKPAATSPHGVGRQTGDEQNDEQNSDTPPSPAATASPSPVTPSLSVRQAVYSDGNPYWAEDAVTITSNVPLTGLKIAVRVEQTGEVASTGTWSSLAGKARINVAADSNAVDYLLTLDPGVTLAPGTYVFEAQYDHAEGTRDAQHDLYAVAATTADSGASEGADGHF